MPFSSQSSGDGALDKLGARDALTEGVKELEGTGEIGADDGLLEGEDDGFVDSDGVQETVGFHDAEGDGDTGAAEGLLDGELDGFGDNDGE